MMTRKIGDLLVDAALLTYFVGVPVSFGFAASKWGGLVAFYACPVWPLAALGYLGYWLGS